jgi:hypothetical protein
MPATSGSGYNKSKSLLQSRHGVSAENIWNAWSARGSWHLPHLPLICY